MRLARSAVLLAAGTFLIAVNQALAFELRMTPSVSIVRPDHRGYTGFWDWGPGAGLSAEVIPDGSDYGIAAWTEFAELPGRTRGIYGDTIAVSPWQQTRVFVGLRAHHHPFRRLAGFSITTDLATGRGVLDFGEASVRSQARPETTPGNRQWGSMFTLGAGLEYIGERFGVFLDVRSEVFEVPSDLIRVYTWNTKRIGLIWRARQGHEAG